MKAKGDAESVPPLLGKVLLAASNALVDKDPKFDPAVFGSASVSLVRR